MLDITLLGTGGGMPMVNRYLSAMIIAYKGRKILIDCGEGTQVAMREFKTGFKSIDLICITHAHGDHIFGLPGLISTIGNSGRVEPITIIGPKGIKEIIKGLMLSMTYLPYDINIIESSMSSFGLKIFPQGIEIYEDIGKNSTSDIIISMLELDHSSPCLGYKFDIRRGPKFYMKKAETNQVPKQIWKKLQNQETVIYNDKKYTPEMVLGEERKGIKLAYITDTRPIDSIVDFIKESNLFICEGTYGNDEDLEKAIQNRHMTYREAARLAKYGGVDELLLTHFSPSMEDPSLYIKNAIDIFSDIIIGIDGFTKILGFPKNSDN